MKIQIEIYLNLNSLWSLMFLSKLGLFEISPGLVVILSLSLVLFIYTETNNRVEAQLGTIKSREILIALENGTFSTTGRTELISKLTNAVG